MEIDKSIAAISIVTFCSLGNPLTVATGYQKSKQVLGEIRKMMNYIKTASEQQIERGEEVTDTEEEKSEQVYEGSEATAPATAKAQVRAPARATIRAATIKTKRRRQKRHKPGAQQRHKPSRTNPRVQRVFPWTKSKGKQPAWYQPTSEGDWKGHHY